MSETGQNFVITAQGDTWQLAHEYDEQEEYDQFSTVAEAKEHAQKLAGVPLQWRQLGENAWGSTVEDTF